MFHSSHLRYRGKGSDAKGIIGRIGYALVGVSYAALAFGAYGLVVGAADDDKSSTTSTQEWTALLLKQPFGVALVILTGLVVIAVALYLFYKAYSAKFRFRLNLVTVHDSVKKLVISFGRFGYASLRCCLHYRRHLPDRSCSPARSSSSERSRCCIKDACTPAFRIGTPEYRGPGIDRLWHLFFRGSTLSPRWQGLAEISSIYEYLPHFSLLLRDAQRGLAH